MKTVTPANSTDIRTSQHIKLVETIEKTSNALTINSILNALSYIFTGKACTVRTTE